MVLPIVKAGLQELVESNHRVTDEVSLFPTPGHVSVAINSAGQKATITGDLMHNPIQIADPEICSNFDFDQGVALETRRTFISDHENKKVLVLGTHFTSPNACHIVTVKGGELRPGQRAGRRLMYRVSTHSFRRPEVVPENVPVLVFDSVVKLPPEANGAIVIGGSNATIYAAYFSAKAGVRAAIHHDCGIGRDEAGVRGLPWAEQHGMAMAAVATESAASATPQTCSNAGSSVVSTDLRPCVA